MSTRTVREPADPPLDPSPATLDPIQRQGAEMYVVLLTEHIAPRELDGTPCPDNGPFEDLVENEMPHGFDPPTCDLGPPYCCGEC